MTLVQVQRVLRLFPHSSSSTPNWLSLPERTRSYAEGIARFHQQHQQHLGPNNISLHLQEHVSELISLRPRCRQDRYGITYSSCPLLLHGSFLPYDTHLNPHWRANQNGTMANRSTQLQHYHQQLRHG